jgi:hypothetical protein
MLVAQYKNGAGNPSDEVFCAVQTISNVKRTGRSTARGSAKPEIP